MKILVTGAGGYLGSALVPKLLSLGHEVIALDHPDYGNPRIGQPGWGMGAKEVVADVTELLHFDQDAIIHLAAIASTPRCMEDPEQAEAVHVKGTANVMALDAQSKIHVSTGAVYGDSSGIQDEHTMIRPKTVYATTKAKGEDVALKHNAMVLRLNNLCGWAEGTRWWESANRIAYDAAVHRNVDVWDPEVYQPFTHIEDAVSAILRGLFKGYLDGLYNVLSENLERGEFGYFAGQCGALVKYVEKGFANELVLNSDKFRRRTGWQPDRLVRSGFYDAYEHAKEER